MLSHTLVWVAWLHQYCRDIQITREQAETAMAMASQYDYKQQWSWGMALCGWTSPEPVDGIEQMRQGLDASGSILWRPHLLALYAEVHAAAVRPDEGWRILDDALGLVEKTGERFHEAELYRLQGEILRNAECAERRTELTSETCFHKALDVARHQQAKSWELRAATSLSRLWQQQGKKREASQLLTDIYGWFTEGFDTADLKDAKVLLEELA